MGLLAKRDQKLLCLIVLVAVLVRLGALGLRLSQLEHSAFEFGEIAKNVAAGRGFAWDFSGRYEFGPTAFMAPFYPGLLALYYLLFGYNLTGMAALQALVLGVVVWGLGYVGMALSGRRVGLLAASIFALYPEAVFMPQKFVAEPWLLLWQMLFVIVGIQYLREGRVSHILIAGLIAGLAWLTKESAPLYVVIFVVWIGLQQGWSRKLLRHGVLLAVITAAVIAPWTARNYAVFGQFIPVRTNFWVNVWRGNHAGATGTPRGADRRAIEYSLDSSYAARINPQLRGDEIHREQVYKQFALEFIRQQPGQYIALCLRRLLYFWTFDPTHPLARNPLYWAPWFVLIGLAALGAYAALSRWRVYSLYFLLILATTTAYGLTMVLPRYRIPLLPGLTLLAAEGISFLVSAWSPAKRVRMN